MFYIILKNISLKIKFKISNLGIFERDLKNKLMYR